MNETAATSGDDQFARRLRLSLNALNTYVPQITDEIAPMARAVAQRERQLNHRIWRRPRVVAASLVFAALLATPIFAAVTNDLDRIAELTGVRENPPQPQPPDYAPADAPYISVQPLMRYADLESPVIPAAAVVTRNGTDIVFVTGPIVRYGRDSYTALVVRAQPVRTGHHLGKALVVTSGIEPCDDIVVAPPESLKSGDRIRSYHQENAEGPKIDYTTLFGGRPAAAAPAIEGGIARAEGPDDIIAIRYHGVAPPNATYRVEAPDGSVQEVPYDYLNDFTNVRISRHALRLNKPVANVQLRDSSGAVISSNALEWYCTG